MKNFFVLLVILGAANAHPQGNFLLDALRGIFQGGGGGILGGLGDFEIPANFAPAEYKLIREGICQNGVATTCTCEDGLSKKSMRIRAGNPSINNLKEVFAQCRPTSCQCSDGSTAKVSVLGCASGGIPRCRANGSKNGRVSNNGPWEMMDKLVCQTTGREISEWDFVSGRLSSNGGCICNEDGLMPVCANTRDRPICPDGTRADRNKNTLPPMFKNCRYN